MRTPPKTTRHHILGSRTALLALALTAALHANAHGQITQRWLTQWGTSETEFGNGLAIDAAGTTWVTGFTHGDLGGPNAGGADIFLTPLSATGVRGTSRQRGGIGSDLGTATAVVGGSVIFAAGSTDSTSAWDGTGVITPQDAVAVRYTTTGLHLGTTRFGSAGLNAVYGAAGNATNLIVAGEAGNFDAFLSKRDSTGAPIWTRGLSTSGIDSGAAAAFDSAGNAYIAGSTSGSLPTFTNAGTVVGTSDLFVARYDASGTQTLLKQWGTSGSDYATSTVVDGSGNIYIAGSTDRAFGGQMNSGYDDAFLTKLNSSGNVLWTRLLGGPATDVSTGLVLDAAGNVWIGGYSGNSTFAGHTYAGGLDAFVALYDNAGNLLDTHFWDSIDDDAVTGLSAGPDGSVSVSGFTAGTLGAASAGDYDAWAASLTTVPEPTTAALLLGGTAFLALRRRR